MITFELNGNTVQSDTKPTARLFDVLRNEFHMNGPKEGCGEGECGACSVIVEDRLQNSCVTALGSIQGKKILTLDGLKATKYYALLEETFAKAGAVQCGFCTPGMIMAAHALLMHNANPTEADIREAISGNLCRCTGYNMIVDAIKMAAERGNGLW